LHREQAGHALDHLLAQVVLALADQRDFGPRRLRLRRRAERLARSFRRRRGLARAAAADMSQVVHGRPFGASDGATWWSCANRSQRAARKSISARLIVSSR